MTNGRGCDCESFEKRIREDERRKFAEILKSKPYFDEVHNMESIPISFIDEVLAEYEEERGHEKLS